MGGFWLRHPRALVRAWCVAGMSMFSTRNGLYERARKKFKIQVRQITGEQTRRHTTLTGASNRLSHGRGVLTCLALDDIRLS